MVLVVRVACGFLHPINSLLDTANHISLMQTVSFHSEGESFLNPYYFYWLCRQSENLENVSLPALESDTFAILTECCSYHQSESEMSLTCYTHIVTVNISSHIVTVKLSY